MSSVNAGEIYYDIGINKKSLEAALAALKDLAAVAIQANAEMAKVTGESATKVAKAAQEAAKVAAKAAEKAANAPKAPKAGIADDDSEVDLLGEYSLELSELASRLRDANNEFARNKDIEEYNGELAVLRKSAERARLELEGLLDAVDDSGEPLLSEKQRVQVYRLMADAAQVATGSMRGMANVDFSETDNEIKAITTKMRSLSAAVEEGSIGTAVYEQSMQELGDRLAAVRSLLVNNQEQLSKSGVSGDEATKAQLRLADSFAAVDEASRRVAAATGAVRSDIEKLDGATDKLSRSQIEQAASIQGLLAQSRAVAVSIRDQTGDMQANLDRAALLRAEVDQLTASYARETQSLTLNVAEQNKVNAALDKGARALAVIDMAVDNYNQSLEDDRIRQAAETIQSLRSEIKATEAAYNSGAEGIDVLLSKYREATVISNQLVEAFTKTPVSAENAAKGMKLIGDAAELASKSARDLAAAKLSPFADQFKVIAREAATLDAELKSGAKTKAQYAAGMAALKGRLDDLNLSLMDYQAELRDLRIAGQDAVNAQEDYAQLATKVEVQTGRVTQAIRENADAMRSEPLKDFATRLNILSSSIVAAENKFNSSSGSVVTFSQSLAGSEMRAKALLAQLKRIDTTGFSLEDQAAHMQLIAKASSLSTTSLRKLNDLNFDPFEKELQDIVREIQTVDSAFAQEAIGQQDYANELQRLQNKLMDLKNLMNAYSDQLRMSGASGKIAADAQERFAIASTQAERQLGKLSKSIQANADSMRSDELRDYASRLAILSRQVQNADAMFKSKRIGAKDYSDILQAVAVDVGVLSNAVEQMNRQGFDLQDEAAQTKVLADSASLAAKVITALDDVKFDSLEQELSGVTTRMNDMQKAFKESDLTASKFEESAKNLIPELVDLRNRIMDSAQAAQTANLTTEQLIASNLRHEKSLRAVDAAIYEVIGVTGSAAAATGGMVTLQDRLSLTQRESIKNMSTLAKEARSMADALRTSSNVTSENIKELTDLKNVIDATRQVLASETASMELNSKEREMLIAGLRDADRAYAITSGAIRRHTGALQSQNLANVLTQGSMTLLTDKIFQASPTLGIFTNSLIYSTQGLRAFLNAALPIIAVAGSIIAVVGTLTASLRSAVGLETALSDVRKTTNFTAEELVDLTQSFQEVSKEIPISVMELMEMARVAGQLGITGRENIERFSVAVAKLAIATDVVGEEGATSLARFLQASGIEAQNLGREADTLGNVLNELENTSAATAREILDMTTYTAGLSSQAGATTDQVLAVNAALLALGLDQEAAGSAVMRVIGKLQIAASELTPELELMAEQSNMSVDEFKALVENSPVKALEALSIGLNESAGEGKVLNNVLTELGIREVRERRTMLALAQGTDVFTKSLRTAYEQTIINNSLDNEIAVVKEKVASKIKMLGARYVELGQDIGVKLLPALSEFIDMLIYLSDNLTAVVAALTTFTAIIARGSIINGIKVLVTGISGLGLSLKAIAGPVGWFMLAASAAVAAAAAFGLFKNDTDQVQESLDELTDTLENMLNTFSRVRDVEGLRVAITNYAKDLTGQTKANFEAAATTIVNSLESGTLTVANATRAVFELYAQNLREDLQSQADDAAAAFENAANRFRNSFTTGRLQRVPINVADLFALDTEDLTNVISTALAGGGGLRNAELQLLADQLRVMMRRYTEVETAAKQFIQQAGNTDAANRALEELNQNIALTGEGIAQNIDDANRAAVPDPVGLNEYGELVDEVAAKLDEISLRLGTQVTSTGEMFTSTVDGMSEQIELYRDSLLRLAEIASMPNVDAEVLTQIDVLRQGYIALITSLTAARDAAVELEEQQKNLLDANVEYLTSLDQLDDALKSKLINREEYLIGMIELKTQLLQATVQAHGKYSAEALLLAESIRALTTELNTAVIPLRTYAELQERIARDSAMNARLEAVGVYSSLEARQLELSGLRRLFDAKRDLGNATVEEMIALDNQIDSLERQINAMQRAESATNSLSDARSSANRQIVTAQAMLDKGLITRIEYLNTEISALESLSNALLGAVAPGVIPAEVESILRNVAALRVELEALGGDVDGFSAVVLNQLDEANRRAQEAFERLLAPVDEDRLNLMNQQVENQLQMIQSIDDELARLRAIETTDATEAVVQAQIAALVSLRQEGFNTYRILSREAELFAANLERMARIAESSHNEYVKSAVRAAAGAEDVASAISMVVEAGFQLNPDILEAIAEVFPVISDRVRLTNEAMSEFNSSIREIDVREMLGFITAQEAMEARLDSAKDALLSLTLARSRDTKAIQAAKDAIAVYSQQLRELEAMNPFDQYNESIIEIDRRMRSGVIPAEAALSERIAARQNLINELAKDEQANAARLSVLLAMLKMEQESLNRMVAKREMSEAMEAYSKAVAEIDQAALRGVIGREQQLTDTIAEKNRLIEAAIERHGRYSSEVVRLQKELRGLENELNRSVIPLRELNEAFAASRAEIADVRRLSQLGILSELEAAEEALNARREAFDVAKRTVGFDAERLRNMFSEIEAMQKQVDLMRARLEYEQSLRDVRRNSVTSEQQTKALIEAQLASTKDLLRVKIANLETEIATIEAQGRVTEQTIAMRREVERLKEELKTIEDNDSLAESLKNAREEFDAALLGINELFAGGYLTQAEALERQISLLESTASTIQGLMGGRVTPEVETLLNLAQELRLTLNGIEADDAVAEALRNARQEFNDALSLAEMNFETGELDETGLTEARIAALRAYADAIVDTNKVVTPQVMMLREEADRLEKSLEVVPTGLERLAGALEGIASVIGGVVGDFARLAAGVSTGVNTIATGVIALGKAQDKAGRTKAWSSIADGVTAVGSALSSVIPRAESFAASVMDGVFAAAGAIAELVLKIPGLGAAVSAVGSLFTSLLGDLSNGMAQVRAEIDKIAESTQYLTRDTIASFQGLSVKMAGEFRKTTERVSRGGFLGLLGFKKEAINKEVMDFVMGIANGLANGFANAMTQAVSTAVAGGDWREQFRSAFKTTVLNAIVNTFVQAALLGENFQKFIQALTVAIATGNMEEANRLINEELPALIADGERQIDEFVGTVPDSLKSYGDSLASSIRGAFASALKGAFLGEKDWGMKFRNAFRETILNALIDTLISSAAVASKFQDFIGRLTKALAEGNIDAAKKMIQEELPGIIATGEEQINDMIGSIPEELRPEKEPEINSTLSGGLNSAFSEAISGAFAGKPDWGEKLREGVKQTLIDSITAAMVEAMMLSDDIKNFMQEFTRILNEEGPAAAARYARDNFNAVVDAGARGAAEAGAILADAFGSTAEDATEKFVEATLEANDFMTESLARTIAFLSEVNGVIDEATSDMMISIAEKISSGFEGGFRDGINAMLAGEEDWRDKLGDGVRDTILQSLIDSFIASAAISTIAADFTEGFLRAMQDPNVDAAQWAKDNVGTAIDGMASLIETFVGSIPDELLPSSNPRSPRYQRPDRSDDGGRDRDRTPRQAGTNISEITGPTRDLLLDLLRPLSILPSWTSMIRDIRNDVRAIATGGMVTAPAIPGMTAQPIVAGSAVTSISIQNLTVQTQATNAREFYNDLSKIAYRDRRGGK